MKDNLRNVQLLCIQDLLLTSRSNNCLMSLSTIFQLHCIVMKKKVQTDIPISTKQTIISHLNLLNMNKNIKWHDVRNPGPGLGKVAG